LNVFLDDVVSQTELNSYVLCASVKKMAQRTTIKFLFLKSESALPGHHDLCQRKHTTVDCDVTFG